MTKEALKLALEALEGLFGTTEQFEGGGVAVWRLGGSAQPKQAIIAIKEALAQPAQEPYDQTALELCEVCGWKTLIPTEGCLNCERKPPLPVQEPVKCLDCGSHNVGIPATYDSLVNSVKAQPAQEPDAYQSGFYDGKKAARARCIELVLAGSSMPVQTKTLEALQRDRKRIAKLIEEDAK